jgi:hypothetical protein
MGGKPTWPVKPASMMDPDMGRPETTARERWTVGEEGSRKKEEASKVTCGGAARSIVSLGERRASQQRADRARGSPRGRGIGSHRLTTARMSRTHPRPKAERRERREKSLSQLVGKESCPQRGLSITGRDQQAHR